MVAFDSAVAVLILAGVAALVRQHLIQGVRGRWTPAAALTLLALGFLLQTPAAEEALGGIRTNGAYLAGHLCVLLAIMATTLHWRCNLSPDPPARWRLLAIYAFYGCVLGVLVYLFATSSQQPHGVGFSREFAGSGGMQAYWIVQALAVVPSVATLARVAARATAQERRWRRSFLSLLAGSALTFTACELWVVVIAVFWPGMPPEWAQRVTLCLQLMTIVLLVCGVIGPVVLGSLRSARLAFFYLEELAPLHGWLTARYPQVRFRSARNRRAETRVTDMLVEISDSLRLLQRDDPVLAFENLLDDETIRVALEDGAHHIGYELAAARNFRVRGYGREELLRR
ncbi:hypothetical protein [Nocardia jejuensis]|uniref:hypothetical protein n=1 Tax=Nocardia jejuensis TaxID=328049 RepID=UPI0012FB3DDB|nr:hypothetical protein [Nocardia jejuensis]